MKASENGMQYTKKALKLMRKFSAGVSCPKWDKKTVKNTMFHPHLAVIAGKCGKTEIDEETARIYILDVHNKFTFKLGLMNKESRVDIEYCMARPKKTFFHWVCIHGKKRIMPITEEQARDLETRNNEMLESLR